MQAEAAKLVEEEQQNKYGVEVKRLQQQVAEERRLRLVREEKLRASTAKVYIPHRSGRKQDEIDD